MTIDYVGGDSNNNNIRIVAAKTNVGFNKTTKNEDISALIILL